MESPDVAALPSRTLGRTGDSVEAVSLGGEGILRTHGRSSEAVPMVLEALRAGVRYCDTAPAYDESQTYYGEAFRKMQGAREAVFLASKTHERSRSGALALLGSSLRALGTDRLDLWQMHDLRTEEDVDAMFARGGAIEAAEEAKRVSKVRFIGSPDTTIPRSCWPRWIGIPSTAYSCRSTRPILPDYRSSPR